MIGVFLFVFSTENLFKYITTRLGVAQKKIYNLKKKFETTAQTLAPASPH